VVTDGSTFRKIHSLKCSVTVGRPARLRTLTVAVEPLRRPNRGRGIASAWASLR
jgi:hypothetical protein